MIWPKLWFACPQVRPRPAYRALLDPRMHRKLGALVACVNSGRLHWTEKAVRMVGYADLSVNMPLPQRQRNMEGGKIGNLKIQFLTAYDTRNQGRRDDAMQTHHHFQEKPGQNPSPPRCHVPSTPCHLITHTGTLIFAVLRFP